MEDLAKKMQDPGFILYVIAVILVTLGLVFYASPRYGQSNILVYIAVCSLIGSLSVLSVKGLGLAIKESIGPNGHEQFSNGLTWFWVISVVGCVTVQLVYLNKSLDQYNTSMVTPIYYVFFTTFVIVASGILFKEWAKLGAADILGNIVGFLVTIIGIFQMQLFRDVNVSWRQLRHLMHKPTPGLAGETVAPFEMLNNTSSLVENGDLQHLPERQKRNSWTSISAANTAPQRIVYS